MDDRPLDLTPLDPLRDPRFDARVNAIVREAFAARRQSVLAVVGGWTRPMLIAAALALAVLLPALTRRAVQRPVSAAEILGVPSTLVDLVASTAHPSLEDIAEALAVGGSHGH